MRNGKSRGVRATEAVSRVLVTGVFIAAGLDKVFHRESTHRYMKSRNMPVSPAFFGGAIGMELVVAPLLALGVAPRVSAPLLSAFLIPTSLIFHDFWNVEGQDRKVQAMSFFKNMAIVGGLLSVALSDYERSKREGRRDERRLQGYGPRPDYLELAQFVA